MTTHQDIERKLYAYLDSAPALADVAESLLGYVKQLETRLSALEIDNLLQKESRNEASKQAKHVSNDDLQQQAQCRRDPEIHP